MGRLPRFEIFSLSTFRVVTVRIPTRIQLVIVLWLFWLKESLLMLILYAK